MGPTCETCRFWLAKDATDPREDGICRRYPPRVSDLEKLVDSLAFYADNYGWNLDDDKSGRYDMTPGEYVKALAEWGLPAGANVYPVMRQDDWCGEHQPKGA